MSIPAGNRAVHCGGMGVCVWGVIYVGIHNSYLLNIKRAAGIMQLGLSGKYVISSYFCHRPLAFPSRSRWDFLQYAIDHFRSKTPPSPMNMR